MSEVGDVTFLFETKMLITDEFRNKLMPNTTEGADPELLKAILRIDVMSGDNGETLGDDYMTWKVTNITSKYLTLQVKFKEPNVVSQGYYPDIMLVYYDFSELKDIHGGHLPPFDHVRREIPP